MINLSDIQNKLINSNKFWIVFTGDSITSCEWVHPNWREIVEYVLKEEMTKYMDGDWITSEWGIRAFNFGYDGSTTKDIVQKIDTILSVNPDLVIGLMGSNDPTLDVSVEESIANINKIIDAVNNINTKIVWANSTPAGEASPKNAEYESYAIALIDSIKSSSETQIIDMFNIYKQFPLDKIFTFISEENIVENIKEGEIDLQHPNQLGNAYIAKVMLKEIFGIEFDPEEYIRSTLAGDKLPSY
ncbi:MAG: GDSL-type esterase/lipase family protein [bacterium]